MHLCLQQRLWQRCSENNNKHHHHHHHHHHYHQSPWPPFQTTASPLKLYTNLEKRYANRSTRGLRQGAMPLLPSDLQRRRMVTVRLFTYAINPGPPLLLQEAVGEEQQLKRQTAFSQLSLKCQLITAGPLSIVLTYTF